MTISNNRDFLFIYEAKHTNPNGDPDNENKPRMDNFTQTNLVSDVRLKRYIRDYFKQQGHEIFVDMQGDSKVTMDKRLEGLLRERMNKEGAMEKLINDAEAYETYKDALSKAKGTDALLKEMINDKSKIKEVNQAVLSGLVREDFIDVRLFGSAFAIKGFNRAVTGPVQLAWGYSLNKVYLLESNTISSIMNDDSSTFGRDHRVKYSLIAFQGTINAAAARHTGLSEADIEAFREAIWAAVSATPTRSKVNQYPLLYVEFTYQDGEPNGSLGDLRRYVSATVAEGIDDQAVSDLEDLRLDFSKLYAQRDDAAVAAVYERSAGRLGYKQRD